MRTIFAEYNPGRNSIDVYTSVGYMLRIDCWEAEKDLKTTSGSDCALNALAIDDPLEPSDSICTISSRFASPKALHIKATSIAFILTPHIDHCLCSI